MSWGDFDNDGDLDLYVAPNVDGPGLLYRNNGDGSFTVLNGVSEFGALVSGDGSESHSPNWVDFDGDGRLDLSVGGVGNLLLFHNESLGLATGWRCAVSTRRE